MPTDAKKNGKKDAVTPLSEGRFAGSQLDPKKQPIHAVKNIADISDELEAGEWIKKPDCVGAGRFNIIGASTRLNTFKGKTSNQYVFELQFLDDDFAGTIAMMSMDETIVRTKYFNAVKRHGAIGPVRLIVLPAQSSDDNDTYAFESVAEATARGA